MPRRPRRLGDVVIAYDDGRVTGKKRRRATCSARERTGQRRPASVTALVPHSWLNRLGIPPWVWNPLSISSVQPSRRRSSSPSSASLSGTSSPKADSLDAARSRPCSACRWRSRPLSSATTSSRGWEGRANPQCGGPLVRASAHLHVHRYRHRADCRVVPLLLALLRAAISVVDPRFEQAARAMGLSRWRIALVVTLPLARRGIVAGIAMAFGRALGGFGATMIVCGSVPMATTMPIALYNAVFYGSHGQAMVLAMVQLGVAFAILLGVSRLGKVSPGEQLVLLGDRSPRALPVVEQREGPVLGRSGHGRSCTSCSRGPLPTTCDRSRHRRVD